MSQNISRKPTLRKMVLDFKKLKIFEIQEIVYMLYTNVQIIIDFEVFSPHVYCVTNAVRTNFAYFDLFLVIHKRCKSCLQWENYILCSLYNILPLNTFSKLSWKVTWIWRRTALIISYIIILNIYSSKAWNKLKILIIINDIRNTRMYGICWTLSFLFHDIFFLQKFFLFHFFKIKDIANFFFRFNCFMFSF
jgi:hypothetical protein